MSTYSHANTRLGQSEKNMSELVDADIETLTNCQIIFYPLLILPNLEYTSQAYNSHTEYSLHNETCISLATTLNEQACSQAKRVYIAHSLAA